MKKTLTNLSLVAIISFLSILPLIVMEFVNRQSFFVSGKETFPFQLFIFLWLCVAAILLILMPLVRTLQAGRSLFAHPKSLMLTVVALVFLTMAVANLINDQMPCFLGVPNCD